jgi:putative redox protein
MELVLMGVAGCSAIDMISILKKQRQEISSFKAEVEGVCK